MTTLVLWIGHGERANDLEWLFELLERCTLDPLFEKYGAFRENASPGLVAIHNDEHKPEVPLNELGTMHYHGNFFDYSCTFSVMTDEIAVISRFEKAISANRSTLAYKEARDERRQQDADRKKAEADRLARHKRDQRRGYR